MTPHRAARPPTASKPRARSHALLVLAALLFAGCAAPGAAVAHMDALYDLRRTLYG